MARVTLHFIGAWRLMLGIEQETIDAERLKDVEAYVESHWGPIYQQRLQSRNIHKDYSLWDNSNVLLNGRNIFAGVKSLLNDGDTIQLLPRVTGG